jgi:spoIIIJ-associated protein
MEEKYVFEGKTSTEAIEKGLKELKLKKDEVEINILKDEKRSFFSILDPRVVKVEIIKKEKALINKENREERVKKEKKAMTTSAIEKAKENISKFLEVFLKQVSNETFEVKILNDEYYITVEIIGENTNLLIGYRGETLNALQTLLSSIANKDIDEKVRVILDISGYKEKRKKVLEELADKISKTVVKTGKKVTLEPMPAYERKIIHSRLQNNKKVTTESVGEEPHRKIIVELKRKN